MQIHKRGWECNSFQYTLTWLSIMNVDKCVTALWRRGTSRNWRSDDTGVSVDDARRLVLLRQAVCSYYSKNGKYVAWQNAELPDVTVGGACNFLISFSGWHAHRWLPPPPKMLRLVSCKLYTTYKVLCKIFWFVMYMGADKSLARPGRKQATATENFVFHISYL